MEEEIEVKDLIEKIYNESPKSSNSIQLSFINQLNINDLFEFLLTYITEGSKILFSNNKKQVNLAKWTDIEYKIMDRYCKSIGFTFIIDRYSSEEENLIDFKKMSYKNNKFNNYTKLSELKLPIKCGEDIFVFSFDFINNIIL